MEADSHASERPRVSCLLVTADRPVLCRRAIRCYHRQTYPNTELVVLDNGSESIKHLLKDLPAGEVRYLREDPSPDRTIGGLRNAALEEATGTFVVPQWDDDDWSHPERIERQVDVLQRGYDACTLPATLMHVDSAAYFHHPFYGFLPDGVPPTIMHRRDQSIRYPTLRRTSDTAFLNAWMEKSYVQLPSEEAHLHLRYCHGGNLWEQEHFLRRMRNTPQDLLLYGWYRFIRRDLFSHPRFRLTEEAQEAFALYLEDSYACGVFEEAKTPSGSAA